MLRLSCLVLYDNRWGEVIINQRCPTAANSVFPGRLLIYATLEYIDGPGELLGLAAPDEVLDGCPMTSRTGGMTFDTADVEVMEASGNFDTVVLHEMAHAIGSG